MGCCVGRRLCAFLFFAVGALAGCAPTPDAAGLDFQPLLLKTDDLRLHTQAARVLKSFRIDYQNADGQVLQLRETVAQSQESVNAVGVVISYQIKYNLYYQLGDAAEQRIRYESVVSHDENRYLANIAKRRQVTDSLRQNALRQMAFNIHR